MVLGAFAICKVGGFTAGEEGKLNQTGYLSILQHNAIQSGTWLVAQEFAPMQDNYAKHTSNSARGTFEAKTNSMSFN